MGEMKDSTRLINVMLNNIPMALGVSALCEGIALMQGQIPGWIWPMYFINVAVAWVLATLIGWFLNPPAKFGVPFAMKRAQPGSKQFGMYVGIIVNTVYTVILVICMTILNTQILAHAPLIGTVMGVVTNFIPVWILCFIISAIFMGPIEKLARSICNDPAPEMPQR